MASTFGNRLKLTLFGQSHGQSVGAVVDGLPAGEAVDTQALADFLQRRNPNGKPGATARREPDVPAFVSGLVNGKTCGAPLCIQFGNEDVRSDAYRDVADIPRPGHADYPALVKHRGHADLRGGGHLSGRLTAPLCAAGGIALQLLARRDIHIAAHILSIGEIADAPWDALVWDADAQDALAKKPLPTLDGDAAKAMQALIEATAAQGDSLGGVIECVAFGLPVGLGTPIFGGVENHLSHMLFGIPAVRGIAFGEGFAAANMRGSVHNDPYALENGQVVTKENHHGGVLGGMATGMPLRVQVAIKPTPSIAAVQQTLRLSTGQVEPLRIQGRHDACIVPRAVPAVEAAVAFALLDMMLSEGMA